MTDRARHTDPKQRDIPLFTALNEYRKTRITHFDVPGHKKSASSPLAMLFGGKTLAFDANSMRELDLLSNPTGAIAEAQALMAGAYGADEAFFLVNGSTLGVEVMIMSVCGPKDKILMPRNVHKSAINGVILSGATPVFLEPEIDVNVGIANGLSTETVAAALKQHTDAKALFIVHPTYFGVCSDIGEIIRAAHEARVPVLVDQAHGAHLNFHEDLPGSATNIGADLTTLSMHKTAGSLTQSSVLLYNGAGSLDSLVDVNRVRQSINLMQTTSASYLFMLSLDVARRQLAIHGNSIYTRLLKGIKELKRRLNAIDGISALTKDFYAGSPGVVDYDETKIVVKVNGLGISGFEAYDALKRDYNVQMELAEPYVALGVAGVGDTEADFERLARAFEGLAASSPKPRKPFMMGLSTFFEMPRTIVSPREAYYSHKITMPVSRAAGQIAGESIMIYPPGIPLIIPGERFSREIIEMYLYYVRQRRAIVKTDADLTVCRVLGS